MLWILVIAVGMWIIGFIIYTRLRKKATNSSFKDENRAQLQEFLAALSVVATIFLSVLIQPILGYPTTSLWPLFYLALFASVERLNTLYYSYLIFSIWLSMFALEANTVVDLFSYKFYLSNLDVFTQCLSLLLLAVILRFLIASVKSQEIDIQALFDLSTAQGHKWFEKRYSYNVLESIVTVAKYLFRAISCEIIFVNSQTGVCYLPPARRTPEEKLAAETRHFFEPTGALLDAIRTKKAIWEDEAKSSMSLLRRFIKWLFSIIPIPTPRTLYLPIKKYPTSTKVLAVLKLKFQPKISGTKLSDASLQQDLSVTSQTFSALMEEREIIQVMRIINQINLVANQGKESSLYRTITHNFAFMFACPTTLWTSVRESPGMLRIQVASRWFSGVLTADEYKNAIISIDQGKIGNVIAKANSSNSLPVSLLAKDTEFAPIYEKLGIQKLVIIPLITYKRPIGAIVLHILTEVDFDLGEKKLMEMLAVQTAIALQHQHTRDSYRELPGFIQKYLTTSNSGPSQLVDNLVQNAIDFLKADTADIYLLDKENWAIIKSRRAASKVSEVRSLTITKEKEELLLEVAVKNYPIFSSQRSKDFDTVVAPKTASYAILPLAHSGRLLGIIVVGYRNSIVFSLEQKFMHNIFSLLAENTLGLMDYREEIRKKLAAEEKSRMSRKIHESLSDRMLAIKNWAQTGMLLVGEDNHFKNLSIHLEQINQLALDAYERLFQLPNEIWSHELNEVTTKGLVKSIEDYYLALNPYTTLQVDSNGFLSPAIPLRVQTDLFRISKLALSNIVRHASAQSVTVQLAVLSNVATMVIKDDGVGFDPNTIYVPRSLGLQSIREIAKDYGGLCEITTGSGLGTVISIRIPFS